MKYRDADDIRGKGTYDKMKAFLQYDQFEVIFHQYPAHTPLSSIGENMPRNTQAN
jgi:hypothetical protein